MSLEDAYLLAAVGFLWLALTAAAFALASYFGAVLPEHPDDDDVEAEEIEDVYTEDRF